MTRPRTVRADDMLAKVARAMCDDDKARLIAGQLHAPSFDESEPDVQRYWLAIAGAAIKEMREPTNLVAAAGWRKAEEYGVTMGTGTISVIWQAMIDAALATDMPGGGR